MRVQEKLREQGKVKGALPLRPIIYEINTWVWLNELSDKYKRRITLANIPAGEFDEIERIGADAVWFMGVWERSPHGIHIANQNANLLADFQHALPDYKMDDNVGSPYCVKQYRVDEHLGGPEGLAAARKKLTDHGLKLILDFVPNHVAPDHPWVTEHPDYFIQGSREDLKRAPNDFFEAGGRIIANGRDPYFPAWPDVAQLNPFNSGLRKAVIDTINNIASQSDGIRCDMAMLLINDIFARTWGQRAGQRPSTEYWVDVISTVRQKYPYFKFIAEAYWDLEWTLQQQGFDYCYDKRLYDRLEHDNAESVLGHLHADLDYQNKLIRFIENHDEPRAAATFTPEKERAAAIIIATTPGAKLFHEGQFEGRHVRLPVFLGRRPPEPVDQSLKDFYFKLFQALKKSQLLDGEWQFSNVSGWPDNQTSKNILSWNWQTGNRKILIAVNLSDWKSQAHIYIPWSNPDRASWRLRDLMSDDVYDREGRDLYINGLYVDLHAWQYHLFQFE
jgi:glycosidase